MRNPLKDPQTGDCILAYGSCGPVSIHIVHRREDTVWFASATFPIRSANVNAFVETMEMANASSMNHLSEFDKWPQPTTQEQA